MEKTKKVLKIVGNVFLWLFVAFALFITVLAFAAQSNQNGIPSIGGKAMLTVATDSMADTFNAGDLIVCKVLSEEQAKKLEKGDVITFKARIDVNGDGIPDDVLNSHRITEVIGEDAFGVVRYRTKGDNNQIEDTAEVASSAILAKWTGTRLRGIGKVLSFLQTPTGFLVVIVLPLLLFFAYEVFRFVRALLAVKNAGKRQITAADEELIKQRAVEEYLRQQAAAQAADQPAEQTEPAEQEQKPEE